LIIEPVSPVAAGMDKYLLPQRILLNNHLGMAGVTQQPPIVAVRDFLYGHPFTIFGNGMFNRSELSHCLAPAPEGTITHE